MANGFGIIDRETGRRQRDRLMSGLQQLGENWLRNQMAGIQVEEQSRQKALGEQKLQAFQQTLSSISKREDIPILMSQALDVARTNPEIAPMLNSIIGSTAEAFKPEKPIQPKEVVRIQEIVNPETGERENWDVRYRMLPGGGVEREYMGKSRMPQFAPTQPKSISFPHTIYNKWVDEHPGEPIEEFWKFYKNKTEVGQKQEASFTKLEDGVYSYDGEDEIAEDIRDALTLEIQQLLAKHQKTYQGKPAQLPTLIEKMLDEKAAKLMAVQVYLGEMTDYEVQEIARYGKFYDFITLGLFKKEVDVPVDVRDTREKRRTQVPPAPGTTPGAGPAGQPKLTAGF